MTDRQITNIMWCIALAISMVGVVLIRMSDVMHFVPDSYHQSLLGCGISVLFWGAYYMGKFRKG